MTDFLMESDGVMEKDFAKDHWDAFKLYKEWNEESRNGEDCPFKDLHDSALVYLR